MQHTRRQSFSTIFSTKIHLHTNSLAQIPHFLPFLFGFTCRDAVLFFAPFYFSYQFPQYGISCPFCTSSIRFTCLMPSAYNPSTNFIRLGCCTRKTLCFILRLYLSRLLLVRLINSMSSSLSNPNTFHMSRKSFFIQNVLRNEA